MAAGKAAQLALPATLGLDPRFVATVQEVLSGYNPESVLTVLAVNQAALALHQLWFNDPRAGVTLGITFKPIYVKLKTEKASITAGFVDARNVDEKLLHKANLHKVALDIPVAHLAHLISNNIMTIVRKEQGRLLVLQDNNKAEFAVELPASLLGKEMPAINAALKDGVFLKQHATEMMKVYDRKTMSAVQVLGIQDPASKQIRKIVSDIDAHAFLQKNSLSPERAKIYDTSTPQGRKDLATAVEAAIQRSGADSKMSNAIKSTLTRLKNQLVEIPSTMGTLSVDEYLVFRLIDDACGRQKVIDNILLHGPTTSAPTASPGKAAAYGEFPAVKEQYYGAIPAQGGVADFYHVDVLAFYLMQQARGYQVKLHDSWLPQLRMVKDRFNDAGGKAKLLALEKTLERGGVISNTGKEPLFENHLKEVPENWIMVRNFHADRAQAAESRLDNFGRRPY